MPSLVLSAGSVAVSSEGSALSAMACVEVILQADPSNTATIFVGGASNQTLKLSAGVTITVPVSNLSNITAKTSAGSGTLNWLAHTKDW